MFQRAAQACAALFLFLYSAGCGNEESAVSESTHRFSTTDGFAIAATVYTPEAAAPPGLILVHRLGKDRSSWEAFARRARDRGYMVIAIDLRGHGMSTQQNGKRRSYEAIRAKEWPAAVQDLQAAKQALLKAGANPANLIVLGESMGGNLALNFAADDPQIQGVILLSPGMQYQGVDAEAPVTRMTTRPVLLMAGERDAYAASSSAKLKELAPGFCDLHLYGSSAHGTDLFAIADEPMEQVFAWLEMIVSSSK